MNARDRIALLGKNWPLPLNQEKELYDFRCRIANILVSLEELLRQILHNSKSLENQKDELLPWLKAHGAHAQITNMFHSYIFGPYSEYQNASVKHHEKWIMEEVEFMLYLTGTLMRFLLTLEKK